MNTTSINSLTLETTSIVIEETAPLVDKSPPEKKLYTTYSKRRRKKRCCSCDMGNYIKSILFGGLDGISTVFVAVATIVNISTGHVPMFYVLIIGVAKLLSGAISMGIGDFMSSKAEVDLIKLERKREMWECENFIRGEMDEMADIYVEKGLKQESAQKMVELMSRNKKAFVDVMMVQELGLAPDYDAWYPVKSGFINFFSFVFFGCIPLIIYIITSIIDAVGKKHSLNPHAIFFIDIGITTFTLIGMGYLKSRYSAQHWISVMMTIVVGIIAAGSGYLVAFLLAKLLHITHID